MIGLGIIASSVADGPPPYATGTIDAVAGSGGLTGWTGYASADVASDNGGSGQLGAIVDSTSFAVTGIFNAGANLQVATVAGVALTSITFNGVSYPLTYSSTFSGNDYYQTGVNVTVTGGVTYPWLLYN